MVLPTARVTSTSQVVWYFADSREVEMARGCRLNPGVMSVWYTDRPLSGGTIRYILFQVSHFLTHPRSLPRDTPFSKKVQAQVQDVHRWGYYSIKHKISNSVDGCSKLTVNESVERKFAVYMWYI